MLSNLASGIAISGISIIPLFFTSILDASMTIRSRFCKDKDPGHKLADHPPSDEIFLTSLPFSISCISRAGVPTPNPICVSPRNATWFSTFKCLANYKGRDQHFASTHPRPGTYQLRDGCLFRKLPQRPSSHTISQPTSRSPFAERERKHTSQHQQPSTPTP